MILDALNRLTPTAQAFAATAVTTDKLALEVTGRDIFAGEPKALVYTVTVAAAVAGTETYEFQAVTATASDGTTGQVIIASSDTFTVAAGVIARGSLAVGRRVVVPLPPEAIPATATHFCGRVVIGSSGTITVLCDLLPLHHVAEDLKKYDDAVTFG